MDGRNNGYNLEGLQPRAPDPGFATSDKLMSERARLFHANPWRGVFYVTGGGSDFIAEMLTTAGASRSVLEMTVPYANSALTELLGRTPEQACSAATARTMAMAAFQRARTLSDDKQGPALFGLACTASLATDREKRGKHRAHIAVQTEWETHSAEITLAGDRATEEAQLLDAIWVCINATLDAQADAHHLPHPISTRRAEPVWRQVLLGETPAAVSTDHDGGLIVSGSFNPLHAGHQGMLSAAEAMTGRAGAFELSMLNADKPPLDYHEVGMRLAQFNVPIWLTRLPTFVDKAEHFPNAIFAVGVDTITRIDAPRFYAGIAGRDAAIAQLAASGCSFLVFGRLDGDQFVHLEDVHLSAPLRRLCRAVPESVFREDISSTELRDRATPSTV